MDAGPPARAAPARALTALAQRLRVSEVEATTMVAPLPEPPPVATGPAAAPASPLVPMTARPGGAAAPTTLLPRRHGRAARKTTTPGNMSCWSTLCFSSSSCATPSATFRQ